MWRKHATRLLAEWLSMNILISMNTLNPTPNASHRRARVQAHQPPQGRKPFRIAFSIFKFAENLSSWGPPHDPAQPAHPAYAAKSPQPAQQAQPSQLSKPSPVQLAQPGDYFVRMRNGWNLGASAALNPKRIWFGWTPAMSGRGWEK